MQSIYKIALAVGLLLLPLLSQAALKVVATTQDLAAIAQAVGGNRVEAISLTPGTRDPHYAEARPGMIRQVYQADLLLLVGADLEIGWLPPLLQAARNARVLPGGAGYLDLSTTVPLLGVPAGPVTRAMGDVHAQGNPHYWLKPANGLRMAQAIAARLSALDGAHAAEYQINLNRFEQDLQARMAAWQAALAPLKDKPVIAYHSSFLYLADAFGLNIVDQVEPVPGIAPGAAHLQKLVARIKADQIGLLIMESYYERRSATYLAEQTGIKIAVLPQSVGSAPEVATYFDLFDGIVAALQKSGAL
ncbi:MAG: metal ABC transporter substrate-binding protein [Gammaproteobacteria bacterium]|nr:metal ABC transporter substrate-binding protein [Gammaproteobacteria bacterium]